MSDVLILPASLRDSPWLARLGVLATLTLCVWKGVELAWLLLAGPQLPAATSTIDMAPMEMPAPPDELAKWHLFGDAAGRIDLGALAQAKLQETALKLTLRGTFNETRPEGGIAIIADEQGVDRSYRVGDALPGDARLEEVLTGVVVLSRNGVRETLSLRLTDAGAGGAASAVAPKPVATRTNLPGAVNTGLMPIQIQPMIAPGLADMQTYRAANLPNVEDLARQVQVFPVFQNGRMRGVRVGAGRDSDILERAGLKPTDVITSVNGISLDSPARQAELLASLRSARQVQVEVERDGKPMKLQFGP